MLGEQLLRHVQDPVAHAEHCPAGRQLASGPAGLVFSVTVILVEPTLSGAAASYSAQPGP